jgi:hypothetical protein
VAVLTGHVLKDPEYILRYHGGTLASGEVSIQGKFANQPRVVAADAAALRAAIERLVD